MDWQAKWIWDGGEASPRNRWQCFRTTFALRDIAAWEQATLSITADARYLLYVNGGLVGRGPARSWPSQLFYDKHEIGHLLKKDSTNVIAVLVLHYGLATFAYLRGRGGLLAQLDFKDSSGATVHTIGTDEQWKTLTHPGYNPHSQRISCQLGFTEQFDSRELTEDWTLPIFADNAWPSSRELGAVGIAPWLNLIPRDILHLEEATMQPIKIESLHTVKPVSWTASLDIRSAMWPESANHSNEIKISGYLATIIRVEQATTATLGFPDVARKFGPVYLNGEVYDFETYKRTLPECYIEVPLKAGDNLYLLDLSGRFHGHTVALGIDCEQPFRLISPLAGDEQATPFVTIGPFEARVLIEHDNLSTKLSAEQQQTNQKLHAAVAKCTKAEDLAAFKNWLRPLPDNLISPESIFSRFVWVKERAEQAVPEALQTITLNNATGGEILRLAGADTEFVVDFGRELSGYIAFEVAAPAGAVLDFYGIEYLRDGWRQQTYELDNTMRYVCREGRQQYVSMVRRGLRYLIVAVRYTALPKNSPLVKFYNIQMLQSNYPVAEVGQFKCSDETLNQIWQISQHTTRLCMEDTYVDCPAYEQSFWVGDSRNAALTSYYLFGAEKLVEHCLKLVPGSSFHSPLLAAQVPSAWNSVIPNWTLLWAIACLEYYERTGNLAFVTAIWPPVKTTLDHFLERRDERGLFNIQAWNLLDWADLDQPADGVVAHQNMLLVRALKSGAELAGLTGDAPTGDNYNCATGELKAAINRYLWSDEEQAFRDSIHADGELSTVFSIHTQLLALLAEVAEGERAAILTRYLQEPPTHFVRLGSPFISFFYYELLAAQGQITQIVDDIRQNYGAMLKYGATTCWEMYPGYAGSHADPRFLTRSHCHAWSTAPAYILPAYVLGIRSLAPGWRKLLLAPQPAGLQWAAGSVPLPDGRAIAVSWQVADDGQTLQLEIRLPADIEIEVQIPAGYQGQVTQHNY